MERLTIGSEEHKLLFCRGFVETHIPYRAEDVAWPDLDPESLARLKALPVWNEAVKTEASTALKVQTLGKVEPDPVLAEAIQGYEEGRHAAILALLTRHYGIDVAPFAPPVPPKDPTWTFLRTGYGECLDSFFAFGLFAIGKRSGFFPSALIDIFEPIMQEEARHILFIVNWAAYLRARRPLALRPAFDARRAWNIVAQGFDRLRGAMAMSGSGSGSGGANGANGKEKPAAPQAQDGFTLKSHTAFGDFKLRTFLELCLSENERRLSPYDPRLLRPRLVPGSVRFALKFLPRTNPAEPHGSPLSRESGRGLG